MIKLHETVNISDVELVNQQSYADLVVNGFKPRNDVDYYKLTLPIDWSIDPFSDGNWTFQLHAWRNLDPVIIEYKKNNNAETLAFILEVIKSWFIFSKENKHAFLWYDMAVGLRSQKLGLLSCELLAQVQQDSEQKAWIYPLIISHLESLMDPETFSLNNHGIFQAHGLMVLAKAFDFSPIRSHKEISRMALERMSQLWSNQFYPEGIHSENSPEYHIFAQRKFVKLAATHWYSSIRLDEALISAKRNFFWLCRPNKQVWPIGDSNASILNVPDDIVEHELLFSPEHNNVNFKYFEQSGYFIAKSRDEKFGLFISTARKNKIHMQSDDLNFEWYDYGVPIIVDGGKYGYTGCKYRRYYKSQLAHNVLLINHNLIHGELFDSCFKKITKKNYGLVIELTHCSINKKIKNTRLIIINKGNFLIVVDRVKSLSNVAIEQRFHLHPDFTLCNQVDNKYDYEFMNNQENLKINVQSVSNEGLEKKMIFGDTTETLSFVSENYRQQRPSHLIVNSTSSKDMIISTLFTHCHYKIEIMNNTLQINNGDSVVDRIDINI